MNDFESWFHSLSVKEQTEYFKKIESEMGKTFSMYLNDALAKSRPVLADLLSTSSRADNKPIKLKFNKK